MSEPFIGELRCFGFNFNPRGWAKCDGQLLPISQNQALFSLLGTIYGGDGRTNFALPELRGRMPIHHGSGPGLSARSQGARSGNESTTLGIANMPNHSHAATLKAAGSNASETAPTGLALSTAREDTYQALDGILDVDMQSGSVVVGSTGGGQSFSNMPPFEVLNWCIALQGLFPSR